MKRYCHTCSEMTRWKAGPTAADITCTSCGKVIEHGAYGSL